VEAIGHAEGFEGGPGHAARHVPRPYRRPRDGTVQPERNEAPVLGVTDQHQAIRQLDGVVGIVHLADSPAAAWRAELRQHRARRGNVEDLLDLCVSSPKADQQGPVGQDCQPSRHGGHLEASQLCARGRQMDNGVIGLIACPECSVASHLEVSHLIHLACRDGALECACVVIHGDESALRVLRTDVHETVRAGGDAQDLLHGTGARLRECNEHVPACIQDSHIPAVPVDCLTVCGDDRLAAGDPELPRRVHRDILWVVESSRTVNGVFLCRDDAPSWRVPDDFGAQPAAEGVRRAAEEAAVDRVHAPIRTHCDAAGCQEFCLLDARGVLRVVAIRLHVTARGGEHLDGRHGKVARSPVCNVDVACVVHCKVCSARDAVLAIAGRRQHAYRGGS